MRHIDMYLDVVQKNAGGGGTGGITPSGTKVIKTNGKHDVTSFAEADVQVPIPEAPTGKKVISVTENGVSTHDVASFAQAEVNVAVPMPAEPTGEKVVNITSNGTSTEDVKSFATAKINVNVPSEGITPTGTKTITENGTHDVTDFAQASVQVPIPPEPAGEKVIEITANGNTKHDVKAFATADVRVNVPSTGIVPEGVKEITSNGTHDVAQYAQAKVNVPQGVTPTGTKEISVTQNGEVTEDVSTYKSVHIVTNVPSAGGSGVPQEKYNQLLSVVNGKVRETNFVNEDMTAIKDYLFQNNTVTVSYTFENVKTVGKYAFANSESLMSQTKMSALHLPIAASLGDGCFQNCMRLETLDTPNVTTLYGPNIFSRCNFLERIVMPKLATYNLQSFRNQYKPPVKLLDILGGRNELDLSELTSLQTIVIRKTDAVVPLYSIVSTSVQSIYVEDTLVEQYKVATNWVNYADKIKPLSTYKEV